MKIRFHVSRLHRRKISPSRSPEFSVVSTRFEAKNRIPQKFSKQSKKSFPQYSKTIRFLSSLRLFRVLTPSSSSSPSSSSLQVRFLSLSASFTRSGAHSCFVIKRVAGFFLCDFDSRFLRNSVITF